MPLTVAQLVARLTADTSNFYRGMAIANSAMLRSGSIMTRVASGVGLATLGMGIMSLRAAGNYQQSMNILEAVSGATTRQMGAMGKEAIQLGADIKLPNVSAKDAADAMTELAKGGLSVKNIMGATRGTLQLGIAANIGFADSATIVARSLKMFNLQGTQAGNIANLLAAGANASTAEITDLAYGMQNAGAQFQGAGYKIQDLVVALSGLVDRGLSGEQAGTALKTMIQRLQNPTKKAAAIMKDLGVNIADAHGNMLPIPNIVSQFSKGFEKLNPLQRQQALNTIFGARANQAMGKLLQIGAKGWDEYAKKIIGTNAAQKMAEARTKGFNGAMQAFGSQVETLAIQLGTAMLPAATSMVRAMSDFVASVNPQPIVAFFTAIKDGVAWIYNLISGSTVLTSILGGLVAGLIAYRVVVGTISIVTKAWAAAQAILNAAMETNQVVLIISALVALGAALYIAYQRSETFRNIVNAAFAAVKNAAQWVVQAAQTVARAFMSAYSSVSSIVRQIVSAVVSAWNTINSATHIWSVISALIRGEINIIRSVVTAGFNVIKAIIVGVWNVVKAVTLAEWNIVKTIITSVIDVIRGKISAMQAFKNIVNAIWAGVRSVTQAAWNAIKGIVTAGINGVKGIISAEIGAIGSLAAAVGRAIGEGIIHGFGGMLGAIKSKIESGLSSIVHHLNPFSPPQHGGEIIGQAMGQGVIIGWLQGTADLPSKMSQSLRNAFEAAKRTVDAQKETLSNSFSQLGSDISSAFDAITQQHKTKSEKLLDSLVSKHDAEQFASNLSSAKQALADAQKAMNDYLATMGGTPEQLQKVQDAMIKVGLTQDAYNQAIGKFGETSSQAQKALLALHSAQEALVKAQSDVGVSTDELSQKQADVAAAQKQVDELMYQHKVDTLTKTASEEDKQYQAQRDLQKRHLDAQLSNLETALAKHPERWQFYQNQIIALLNRNGITYQTSGLALGNAFAQGLRESVGNVRSAAQAVANAVASVLKLHSPADTGPLSDLHRWWQAFAPTLLKGLDTGAIQGALTGALTPAGAGVGAALGATGGGRSAQVIEEHYHILENGGTVIGTRLDQAAKELRDLIYVNGRRSGGTGI